MSCCYHRRMGKANLMEKKQVGEVYRLFVIIFFFAASILLLNNQKRKSAVATHIDAFNITEQSVINVSVDQAYHHMNSLFVSHNVDLIIKVINQCMHQFTIELVEKIISDNTYLSSEEKMKIIFGTASYCSAKKNMHYRLLDFLLEHPHLYEQTPALLVLMRSAYVDSLPFFINWGKDRQKSGRKDLLAQFIEPAFMTAINQNDVTTVENMFNKKICILPEKASLFLWHVVTENKNCLFVPILVKYGQADINYAENGKTLLIEAVEQDNKDMVQALLDHGAVVDRIVDPIKGTALQIAIALKSSITELLREYGA